MSGLTYLITGAARGLGKGLLATFVARPNTTVIAAVRDIQSARSVLKNIPVGKGSKILIVKIDSSIETDPAAAVEELRNKYQITHIDVLIANAGILEENGLVATISTEKLRKHFEVNTIAPIILFQAFKPLLDASSSPRFFVMSSNIGSIEQIAINRVPFAAYGASKAAINYFVRQIEFENPGLISMPVNPGFVQTDMGKTSIELGGLSDALIAAMEVKFDDSIKGPVKLFDEASLENTVTFTNFDGETLPL